MQPRQAGFGGSKELAEVFGWRRRHPGYDRRVTTMKPQRAALYARVSTKDQETDRVWGTRQGAKGYLVKPVVEDDLIKTINSLIA